MKRFGTFEGKEIISGEDAEDLLREEENRREQAQKEKIRSRYTYSTPVLVGQSHEMVEMVLTT